MGVPVNKSGVSTRSTINNNVFFFFQTIKKNLDILLETGCIDDYQVDVMDMSGVIRTSKTFVTLFETYLRSDFVSSSDLDLKIIELKLEGLKNTAISNILNIKSATLRTRLARLTRKVYHDVFEQESVPTGVVCFQNKKALVKAITKLNLCLVHISIDDNFAYNYQRVLKDRLKSDYNNKPVILNRSYLNSLYLLFTCTISYFDAVLSQISDNELTTILRQLSSNEYNDTKKLFAMLTNDALNFAGGSNFDAVLKMQGYLNQSCLEDEQSLF